MLKNYNTLSEIKGFMDILVKYLINLKDYDNFLSIFENKKTPPRKYTHHILGTLSSWWSSLLAHLAKIPIHLFINKTIDS